MIKKFIPILALLFLALPAHATWVQGSSSNIVTATSTVCTPGTVTAGHRIVMAVDTSNLGTLTISGGSISWISVFDETSGATQLQLWEGAAVSSASLSITVSLSSAAVGSVCGEFTSTTLDQGGSGTGHYVAGPSTTATTPAITTLFATEDIVAVANYSMGYAATTSPFTFREGATSGGTTYLALASESVTSIQTSLTASWTMISGATNNGIASFYTPGAACTPELAASGAGSC